MIMAENTYELYGPNTASHNDGANAARTARPKLLDPISFAAFVVASFGGVYRQLANVRYELPEEERDKCLRGADAVRLCLRIVLALSHPSNRIPIEGELALAANAYTHGGLSPTATGLDNNMLGRREVYESHTEPWPRAPRLREFPFISLALRLAASYDPALRAYDTCMLEEPLGLIYDDNNVKYAIGIIDITDIDAVRYGIVAAGHHMVHIPQVTYRLEVTYDCAVDFRTRIPLSAQEYMEKFQYEAEHDFEKDAISLLQALRLISTEALQAVWPDAHLTTAVQGETEIPEHSTKSPHLRNLADLAASSLIESLFESTEDLTEGRRSDRGHDDTKGRVPVPTSTTSHNASIPLNVPIASGAQAALRREMLKRAPELQKSPNASHLLAVAFSRQAHLPWAAFDRISVAVLHAALQHPGIRDAAESISLCIDTIQGTPEAIVTALCTSGISFRYLCFHQSPQRRDDSCTTELYEHLLKSSLLGAGVRLTLTGACSSALRCCMWCPDVTNQSSRHFQAFPMQHLFICTEMNPSGVGNKAFLPSYMSLADTLLAPEDFAATFLVFLSGLRLDSIAIGEQAPLLFGHCPTSLADLTFQPTQAIHRGFHVAHPAAENLAVPILPFSNYSFSNRTYVGESLYTVKRKQILSCLECWPLVRDMVSGAWTVVVSRERRKISNGRVTETADHDAYGDDTVVRYAFIKAGEHGQIVLVGDLSTFLAETAPELGRETVIQQIAQTEDHIRESLGRSLSTTQGQSTSYINVFEENDALNLLSVFLEDAKSYGRDALHALMQEDRVLTHDWYPDFAAKIPQGGFDTAQDEVVLPRRSSTSFVNLADMEDED